MTTKKASPKKKVTPKKKAAVKTKVAPKRNRVAGAVTTKQTQHKRNKNNLTIQEQAFADAILQNREGDTATDIVLTITPNVKRSTARVRASNWMADERIKAYMNSMRDRVEDQVEYNLVQWRADVLELIEITLGRKETEQAVTVTDPKTQKDVKVVKKFQGVDPKNAKAALELMAKQMKILTEKTELDIGDKLREIFEKVSPTTGPPSLRDQSK